MLRALKIGGAVALAIFSLVYLDLTFRARSAYQEGEKYEQWHRSPDKKKAHYDALFNQEKARLESDLARQTLTQPEYQQLLELAEFRRDEAVAESSLKYAYHWYKTSVELFSPPESRWVRLSRDKMAKTKELWKNELDAKKIPYEEYMLE